MSAPPRKRRRFDANPYLDLEATVDEHDQLEADEDEDEDDLQFINNESLEDEDPGGHALLNRQQLVDILREDKFLESNAPAAEEEGHSDLLREWVGLGLEDDEMNNPLDGGIDDEENEAVSVPRPLWAEIAHTNAAVAGALSTWQDDNAERQISAEDGLYEVSCQPGMEETIVFRIHSWAIQLDSAGPTKNHILERSARPSMTLPCNNTRPPESQPKRVVLARSAIANPFLPGRVYIESAKIGYVQRLARRVRGLNPASVRPVPRDLLLRPLLMMRHSFPDRTFVRLLDPYCPTMTCLIVKDFLLMVPGHLSSPQGSHATVSRFNADTEVMAAPPPRSSNSEIEFQRCTPDGSNIQKDQYGFRYIPLKNLQPRALQVYNPSSYEIELLYKFGRLNNRHYKSYMSRTMAYGFSTGDRVIFQAGSYDQLTGTILNSDADGSCSIYVPSQGDVIQAQRQQLRRHFCVGDHVSGTTNDVIQRLGSRTGWVVSASEGYKASWSTAGDIDPATGQPRIQVGYRVDLRVHSTESGREIIAAHYEFQFEDSASVSLHAATPSPISEMVVGAMYTLTISVPGVKSHSFFSVVTDIEGVRVWTNGTDRSSEVSGVGVFNIWDKNADAPFGYPRGWTAGVVDFTDFDIKLGDLVSLKDRNGRCGTARITNFSRHEVSLANFTGIKIADLGSVRQRGPYDNHIDKTVRVRKGPDKGGLGVVKTVNKIGTCTVELNTMPIRVITVDITRLCAADESSLYLSLIPLIAPPVRAQTPPASAPPPSTSEGSQAAFQPDSSDVLVNLPRSPEFDCSWLNRPFAQNIRVKLEPIHRKVQCSYHFAGAFYDNSGSVPRLMIRVFDRQKERDIPADELKWLPASDINQTVVRVTGDNSGTLYRTVLVDNTGHCHIRQVPSQRGAPVLTLPQLELAQVNAKRS